MFPSEGWLVPVLVAFLNELLDGREVLQAREPKHFWNVVGHGAPGGLHELPFIPPCLDLPAELRD